MLRSKSQYFAFCLNAFLCLGIISCGKVMADPFYPFQGPGQPVSLEDVLPHFDRPECRSNEFYSEWWSFVFVLEGRYGAYAQFVVSNLGPGDGKAAVRADLDLPDGRSFHENIEISPDGWRYEKDKFALYFGENSVSGPLNALVLRLKNKSFEAEYVLTNIFPPWKPGNGCIQYGSSASRYYQIQLIAPVAEVKGEIRVTGEAEVRKVKGLMYVDHSVSTVGMHEQARRWIRFRALDPKTAFFLTYIYPPAQYGENAARYAVLFHDGQVVFESLDFDLKLGDFKVDDKKSEYSYAQVFEASGSSPKRFRVAVKATKMTNREDYLETMGAAKRFIVARFAKPVMYYFDAVYAAEVGDEKKKFGGKGRYYFTIVNP